MGKLIFLLLLLTCNVLLKAQSYNYLQANRAMLTIPADKSCSTTDIAEYVKQYFNTDREKVSAIYTWVASNIKYDTDSANHINLGRDKAAKITAALRRKKGVCENFAAIFNDICIKAGIMSFIIDGYTKQHGSVDRTGHSWCAVVIDNEWFLCDPTWDSGTGNTKYLLVNPSDMIASHMPFDPMWQLLEYPVSHRQFYNGTTYSNKNQLFFNYADSIAAYTKMDSLQRFKTAAIRIEQSGLYNTLIRDKHAYAKMHIALINEDKDVDNYNSAVADLNKATAVYNSFAEYRNNKFIPAVPENELRLLLEGIDAKLSAAYKKLDAIDNSETTFKFSTQGVRDRLNSLAGRVKEQQSFLTLYLNTATASRESLFYKQVTSK